MTRNLLLLTYHFPPSSASGTFRMLGFARHLRRFGWRVQVIAPPEMPWDPVDPALSAQVPTETNFHAVPYPKSAPRWLRFAAGEAIWLPFAWRACREVLRRDPPDLVLTSGPPHVIHLLGLWLKQTQRLPWVADFRDPWISGAARITLWKRWLRCWEKQVFRHADRVVANAPNAQQLFCDTYPRHAGKVVTLTNGFDPPAQRAPPPPFTGRLRMLHAGEIYAGRDPLPLLDAMAELKNAPAKAGLPLRFEVMGAVHLAGADLGTEAARRGLASEVQVRGQLPYQETLHEMAQSDLLLLLDGPGRKIGVPAKLYEYFGAGRPILALAEPDGDTANILRASGILHRIAPPKNAGLIRQAIMELAGELAAAPTITPDPERLRRFTRESVAGELAGIMDQEVARAFTFSARRPCATASPLHTACER
jgi:glycosyltransferase involved in cell wall biosynthesis